LLTRGIWILELDWGWIWKIFGNTCVCEGRIARSEFQSSTRPSVLSDTNAPQ